MWLQTEGVCCVIDNMINLQFEFVCSMLKKDNDTHLKCRFLNLNCVSIIPVVLTLVLKTSCNTWEVLMMVLESEFP